MTLNAPPTRRDTFVLIALVVICTFNPFYLNRPIDLFELGLYLPGMNALLHGLFPFRDFFHLRGPLDIWFPAKLMQVFGTHMSVLSLYFYIGNILCLIGVVLIAKELVRSRYMLYVMMPVIITRAFPRVIYTIWGGLRYALGLLAVWMLIKAFKRAHLRWLFAAGITTVTASLVSIEMGVYVFAGVAAALVFAFFAKTYERAWLLKAAASYMAGVCLVAGPFVLYYAANHAFMPYVEATLAVVLDMQKVIDPHAAPAVYPHNFPEAFVAMINPLSVNFKQMTPSYTYLALLIYVLWRLKRNAFGAFEMCLVMLGVYGFIMYNTGFRCLWTAQFEMALMPEKILYFVLAETGLWRLWQKRQGFKVWYTYAVLALAVTLFVFSVGYAVDRLNHRFFAFQYVRDALRGKSTERLKYFTNEPYIPLTFARARGIQVPVDQAKDLEAAMAFIAGHTKAEDIIIGYPQLAIYNFFADRPFLGRFPMATFAWFKESWYQEFIRDLRQNNRARYLFFSKNMPDDLGEVYFAYHPNRFRFEQTKALIERYYTRVGQTPLSYIYQRRN